jgi:hypothetical protein
MSTTTDTILNAIAAIELQDSREQLSYRAAAKIFGVDRTTLRRRYITRRPDESYYEDASFLILRRYLASERPTPPTNADLRNYFLHFRVDTPYWRGSAALSIWQI